MILNVGNNNFNIDRCDRHNVFTSNETVDIKINKDTMYEEDIKNMVKEITNNTEFNITSDDTSKLSFSNVKLKDCKQIVTDYENYFLITCGCNN